MKKLCEERDSLYEKKNGVERAEREVGEEFCKIIKDINVMGRQV